MLNRILVGRLGYLLGFLVSFGVVGVALYLQQQHNLEPCPLCIFQRIAFMVLGLLFLMAALHYPTRRGRKIYGFVHVVAAAAGASIAARHMWIQANPDKVMTECGAGMGYMFNNFPPQRALSWVFKGTGECTSIDWTFFGITIPQLSLIAYVALGVYALLLAAKKK